MAAKYIVEHGSLGRNAIVADTGGTTYDVALVRDGVIPETRETWIGQPYLGHMTGFPSVDISSVGAGGGSIAGVDEAGLLHVGPQSAGARCRGRPAFWRGRDMRAHGHRCCRGAGVCRSGLFPGRPHASGS